MKISFYAPFKPLGHANPSGDLVTAAGIADYLGQRGHQVFPASSLRCRWIYWKPWRWLHLLLERQRVIQQFSQKNKPDVWFTYHTYYKAPDLLGPAASKRLAIPYVIFQGIYSTKRKRKIKTLPGFHLNKQTLCAAQHVFTNKQVDLINLKRLLPADRITYVAPGLDPQAFSFDADARVELQRQWNIGIDPVVLSAAMFRRDVKTEGLIWVIRTCSELVKKGSPLKLVIAGDGRERNKLRKLAEELMPGRVHFAGKIPRYEMNRFYSAGDVFVFPGINESLGMVYLEAQACGLPVVAFNNAGVPDAVRNGKTGILVPLNAFDPFVTAIERLLTDTNLRKQMGNTAQAYVRKNHDLNKNYQAIERILRQIVARF
jgi:glycosyltransferase involved in cell wall biosynthesis